MWYRRKLIFSGASTIGTAHDLNVRDRAGEIGIPFTSGMRITLAEGLGFRRNRDQISRAFHRDDCRVLYWVLPQTALSRGRNGTSKHRRKLSSIEST